MVNKGPRRGDARDPSIAEALDEELRQNPPIVEWMLVPNSGGLHVAVFIHDPQNVPGRRLNPPCGCNLFGSPRRRKGPHHEGVCGRWAA